ncbi:hypothetical protein GCM10009721_42690 [Terrabacter tumescens]|uniref:Uncharacterized protein n=1 Tax=Terrabacter tumescens TaxID=60443 RepID=A0ABQ2IJP3_9MICO|nr:hypothetical protein [Terrabacter tumescens]GGN10151.1 hypothetical protein GCM10009721_42690 [Terrabacter tumescens]
MKHSIRAVSIAVVSAAAIGLSPMAAQATTTTISGNAGLGTTLYSTVRSNTYAYNKVSISNFSQAGGYGGCTELFLRDRTLNREIAGTGCIDGRTGTIYFKMLANGSTAIPKGSFSLDMYMSGACGGTCSTVSWKATLTYNVQSASPATCVASAQDPAESPVC